MENINTNTRGTHNIKQTTYSRSVIKLLVLSLLFTFSHSTIASNKKLITINQFVPHQALSAAREGIQSALSERKLLGNNVELQISNANGSITNAVQIAKHHASLSPAFMIAIASASAQANLKARNNKQTILGFVAITDPKAVGLKEEDNVIGVTDSPPVEELIEIVLQIFPNLKTVGTVSNPGEVNSVEIIKTLEEVLLKRNIALKTASLHSSNDARLAVQKLVGKVDLIYLPQDNTIIPAIDAVVQEALKANIPVIANDPILVDNGVLLALGCDYFNSGKQLGFMIADIIEGHNVTTKIQVPNIKELKINKRISDKLDIRIPDKVQFQIDKVKS